MSRATVLLFELDSLPTVDRWLQLGPQGDFRQIAENHVGGDVKIGNAERPDPAKFPGDAEALLDIDRRGQHG